MFWYVQVLDKNTSGLDILKPVWFEVIFTYMFTYLTTEY